MIKFFRCVLLLIIGAVTLPSWSFETLPEAGMWSFDGEVDGNPGRGLQIDHQNAFIMIVTYFGYRGDGRSMFLQSSGYMEKEGVYKGPLQEFRDGRSLTSPPRSGKIEKDYGEIEIEFDSPTSATVRLPGDTARRISRFVVDPHASGRIRDNNHSIRIGLADPVFARVSFENNRFKMTTRDGFVFFDKGCIYDGDLARQGNGYRSEGTYTCGPFGNLRESAPKPYRIESLVVNTDGVLSGRMYYWDAESPNPTMMPISGVCFSSGSPEERISCPGRLVFPNPYP